MTSQLKWDSGLGAGNLLFLCHNDTAPHSHKIRGSVADLTGITKRQRRNGLKSPLEIGAHLSYRMNVKQRGSMIVSPLIWYELSLASIAADGIWFSDVRAAVSVMEVS